MLACRWLLALALCPVAMGPAPARVVEHFRNATPAPAPGSQKPIDFLGLTIQKLEGPGAYVKESVTGSNISVIFFGSGASAFAEEGCKQLPPPLPLPEREATAQAEFGVIESYLSVNAPEGTVIGSTVTVTTHCMITSQEDSVITVQHDVTAIATTGSVGVEGGSFFRQDRKGPLHYSELLHYVEFARVRADIVLGNITITMPESATGTLTRATCLAWAHGTAKMICH